MAVFIRFPDNGKLVGNGAGFARLPVESLGSNGEKDLRGLLSERPAAAPRQQGLDVLGDRRPRVAGHGLREQRHNVGRGGGPHGMRKMPLPITDARSWVASQGIIPWYARGRVFSPLGLAGLKLWLDAAASEGQP